MTEYNIHNEFRSWETFPHHIIPASNDRLCLFVTFLLLWKNTKTKSNLQKGIWFQRAKSPACQGVWQQAVGSNRSSELRSHIFNNKHRMEKENQTWGKWCPSSSTVLHLNPLSSQQASIIIHEPIGTFSTHEPMGTFSLTWSHPEGILSFQLFLHVCRVWKQKELTSSEERCHWCWVCVGLCILCYLGLEGLVWSVLVKSTGRLGRDSWERVTP